MADFEEGVKLAFVYPDSKTSALVGRAGTVIKRPKSHAHLTNLVFVESDGKPKAFKREKMTDVTIIGV